MPDARIAIFLLLSAWFSYAVVGPPGPPADVWNSNAISRMAMPLSVLQQGTLRIDPYAGFTIDKAVFEGHVYLDKAPGQSLLAMPFLAVLELASRAVGKSTATIVDGNLSHYLRFATWVAAVLTSALPTACASAAVFLVGRELGASRAASVFGAVVLAFCTPAFGWSTVLFGHALAGGCLFVAFALVVLQSGPRSERRLDLRCGALAGFLLSYAVVTEFTSAPAALLVGLVACARLSALPRPAALRLAAAAMAGGAAGGLVLLAYNLLSFGSPLHFGYSDVVGFEGMQEGLFGVSLPRPGIIVEILLLPRRGIVWIAPLLLLAPLAWLAAARRFPMPIAAVLLLIPCAYVLVNSGYHYWHGGYSTGPRHIVPALPFVSLAFVPLWDAAGRAGRWVLGILAGVSAVLSLVCATVDMTAPERIQNPLLEYLIPEFLAGNVNTLLRYLELPVPVPISFLVFPVAIAVAYAASRPLERAIAR